MKIMHNKSPHSGDYFVSERNNAEDELRALLRLRDTYGYEFCCSRFPALLDYFVLTRDPRFAEEELLSCVAGDDYFVNRMFSEVNAEALRLFCITARYEK